MSAAGSNQPGEGSGGDSPRPGLGGIVRRVRSALTKSKSSPNMSAVPTVAADEPAASTAQEAAPQPTAPPPVLSTPEEASKETVDARPDEAGHLTETPEAHPQGAISYRLTRQQLWEERAQQIFEKYDLSLDPSLKPLDTTVDPTATVERVKKPVRMRVHRYCHRCEACFGPERICASCEHRRCKKCTRYPRESSRTRDGSLARRAKAKKEEQHTMALEPLVVIQNPQTGRQILVHNRVGYRTRRSCHKCDAEFVPPTTRLCADCGHTRCSRCPRVPATTAQWKQGYPGEAEASSEEEQLPQLRHMRQERVFRKPRQRVRWNCDQCSTLFSEGQKTCQTCGHEKCHNCRRHPPKKNRQDFDPEIVRVLNEKLSALVINRAGP